MELIRRNSDYVLRGLVYMAGFPLGKKFTINSIAKKQDLPLAFLRKIFQKLSINKIVGSQTGPKGGFYLLKGPEQVNLREIIEAVQGRISLSDCLFESNLCSRSKTCKVKQELFLIQKKLCNLLDKYHLCDFITT